MKEPKLAIVLRYLIYATAFVPLVIFSQFISPFHFGKVIVFRSIIEVAVVLYLLLIWQDRSYLPRPNKIFWSFFFFASAFSLATVFSVQKYESFWGGLERMGGVLTFWHYFIFFLILTAVFKRKEHWLRLLELTVLVGVLSSFYGFGQKTNLSFFIGSGDRARIFGTIGNAALFAGYEILNLFLALTLFSSTEYSGIKRKLFAGAFAIDLIAVLMTAVRGSLLGVGVGFLVFAFLYAHYYRSKLAKNALISLMTLLVLFMAVAMMTRNTSFVQNSGYLNRITEFSPQARTVQTRFWAWHAGFEGWIESPKTILLGWGPENFNIPFSRHFNPKFFMGPGSETLFDRAHNMFVEILVTMGLIGIGTYLFIFFSVFKTLADILKKRSRQMIYAIGFIPMTIAYMIHNSFIFDTSANFLIFFTILGFIYFISNTEEADRGEQGVKPALVKKINPALRASVATVLFIIVSLLIYKINIVPVEANHTVTRAIVKSWSNDFKGAVDKYKEAMSYDVPGKYDYRHRLAQYMIEYASSKSLTPELVDDINYTLGQVQINIDERSMDYLPELYMSRLNIILGKGDAKSPYNDEALRHSLRALSLSPTFVRTYYEIGQAYLNKKDYPNAIAAFKKAAELNPEVGLSFWYWGLIVIESGNSKEGIKIIDIALTKNLSLTEADYLRIVNAYFQANDYNGIVQVYLKLIAMNPKSAQYHASLAAAYVRLGLIDNAVSEAKKAALVDPTFETEARAFVKSVGREW